MTNVIEILEKALTDVGNYFSNMTSEQFAWEIVGILGVILFFTRWVVQWVASERRAQSHVPQLFWYLSFAGAAMTLSYAIYIGNFVFILGNSTNALVYTRNLMLLHKNRKKVSNG